MPVDLPLPDAASRPVEMRAHAQGSQADGSGRQRCLNSCMGHNAAVILGLIVMVALIVGLDVAFLRDHFIFRLTVNVGIVLVFAVLYFSLRNHI